MQHRDVLRKLEDSKRTEPSLRDQRTGIRTDAILKLHIIDAENLPSNIDASVHARQDQSSSKTNKQSGSGPIWNEAIIFDIKNEMQPLVITLKDESGRSILSENIDLMEHKEYSEMGKDKWIPNQ